MPPSKQSVHFASRYGLSVEQYNALVEKQHGLCAGCGRLPKPGGRAGVNRFLFVDHDHSTGAVRGLLCQPCNAAVGLAGDSPEILLGLAAYLERPPAISSADLRYRRRHGDHQRARTHCVRGHEFSPSNTRLSSDGHRICLECRRTREAKRQRAVRRDAPTARRSDCHPDRPHYGHGLCARCWDRRRRSKNQLRLIS